jgi:hypothetical protein
MTNHTYQIIPLRKIITLEGITMDLILIAGIPAIKP